ncbi:hypothetical protein GIB67_024616, partial [Kingdonia uniflora]
KTLAYVSTPDLIRIIKCFLKWKRSKGRRSANYVMCRARWKDRKNQERYLNLAAYISDDDNNCHGPARVCLYSARSTVECEVVQHTSTPMMKDLKEYFQNQGLMETISLGLNYPLSRFQNKRGKKVEGGEGGEERLKEEKKEEELEKSLGIRW